MHEHLVLYLTVLIRIVCFDPPWNSREFLNTPVNQNISLNSVQIFSSCYSNHLVAKYIYRNRCIEFKNGLLIF